MFIFTLLALAGGLLELDGSTTWLKVNESFVGVIFESCFSFMSKHPGFL